MQLPHAANTMSNNPDVLEVTTFDKTKLNTTKSMLYDLLESIDLMLLKFTRWAYKATGHLEDYIGIVNWMGT